MIYENKFIWIGQIKKENTTTHKHGYKQLQTMNTSFQKPEGFLSWQKKDSMEVQSPRKMIGWQSKNEYFFSNIRNQEENENLWL